jgi:large subunit ribosomal protein L17
MLSNMACSLIQHKRINTTVAKAKALRGFVEPLITKSKDDSTHSRRIVFSYLNDKFAVTELFREVAPKIGERAGGYTRIIRTGNRLGDNADMCMMELVDFNELYVSEGKTPSKKKTRRRRGGSGSTEASTTESKVKAETSKEETPKAEAKTDEVKAEKKTEAKKTAPKAEAKKTEAPKEAKKEAPKQKDLKKEEGDNKEDKA